MCHIYIPPSLWNTHTLTHKNGYASRCALVPSLYHVPFCTSPLSAVMHVFICSLSYTCVRIYLLSLLPPPPFLPPTHTHTPWHLTHASLSDASFVAMCRHKRRLDPSCPIQPQQTVLELGFSNILLVTKAR
jgi:hypothetical protein